MGFGYGFGFNEWFGFGFGYLIIKPYRMSNKKIPSPPKYPLNPYFRFRQQVYDEVKADNISLDLIARTKLIAMMYKNLDPKTKYLSYEQPYNKDKLVYIEKKKEYLAKYGGLLIDKKNKKKSLVKNESEETFKKKKKAKSQSLHLKKEQKNGNINKMDEKTIMATEDTKISKSKLMLRIMLKHNL